MANKFSPEVADKLLDKLSSDDDFRASFLKNPRAALGKVGHETPEGDRDVNGADPVLCCYGIKSLASKEELKRSRDKLRTQLSSTLGYDVFKASA